MQLRPTPTIFPLLHQLGNTLLSYPATEPAAPTHQRCWTESGTPASRVTDLSLGPPSPAASFGVRLAADIRQVLAPDPAHCSKEETTCI